MRIAAVTVVGVLLTGCVSAPPTEADVVAYAKALAVSDVDTTLSSNVAFSSWLAARAEDGRVIWESNDCGEQTGDPAAPPRDFPVCAEAHFLTCDGVPVSVSVVVGTIRRGIEAPVELRWAITGDASAARDYSRLSAFAFAAPACHRAHDGPSPPASPRDPA